jgi:hypothetical protein
MAAQMPLLRSLDVCVGLFYERGAPVELGAKEFAKPRCGIRMLSGRHSWRVYAE